MSGNQPEDVTKLRNWPEIGTVYLVPSIYIKHCGLLADWPVYGAAHIDKTALTSPALSSEFVRRFLHAPHFHVDPRFLSPAMDEALARQWRITVDSLMPGRAVVLGSAHPDHLKAALSFGLGSFDGEAERPTARPMICVRSVVPWDVTARDETWPWAEKYVTDLGSVQGAVMSSEGLPLCPHHGLNLHCVWDGRSATVRCPMHGLEVDMRRARIS